MRYKLFTWVGNSWGGGTPARVKGVDYAQYDEPAEPSFDEELAAECAKGWEPVGGVTAIVGCTDYNDGHPETGTRGYAVLLRGNS